MALETSAERSVWQCLLNVYGLSSNCVEAYNTWERSEGELVVSVAAAVETGILFWIIGAFIYFSVRLLCADSSAEYEKWREAGYRRSGHIQQDRSISMRKHKKQYEYIIFAARSCAHWLKEVSCLANRIRNV